MLAFLNLMYLLNLLSAAWGSEALMQNGRVCGALPHASADTTKTCKGRVDGGDRPRRIARTLCVFAEGGCQPSLQTSKLPMV